MYYARLSTAQMIKNGLDGIYKNQGMSNDAMIQLATGKRTDLDPVEEAQLLNYKVSIENQAQHNRNIDNITPKFEAQESSMRTVEAQLTNLQDILIKANNSITAGDKGYYFEEYKAIKQSIMQQLNAKDIYGQYLYSGYESSVKPFDDQLNYLGDTGKSEIRIADNTTVQVNTVGSDLATSNLQNVISKLDGYFTNPAQLNMDTSVLDDVQNSLVDVSVNITKIGNKLNRIEMSKNANEDVIYTNKVRVSAIEDVDMVKAAADFAKAQAAYQAALKTQATIQQLSLFNYV